MPLSFSPFGEIMATLSRRTLLRIEAAEDRETNPHLKDDYRIAWLTRAEREPRIHSASCRGDLHGSRCSPRARVGCDRCAPEGDARRGLRQVLRRGLTKKARAVGALAAMEGRTQTRPRRGLRGELALQKQTARIA